MLFTDLVGSTRILDELGDDAADRHRRRHFRVLRDTLVAFGGREVKSLGDGVMAVFHSASDALACAVAMQQTVARGNVAGDRPAAGVRIGLHAGESLHEDDDYFGTPVVVAKRLCDAASAGQIVVSEVVRDLVGTRGGHAFRSLGELELKGIRAPLRASEVDWSDAPAQRATDAPRRRTRVVVVAAAAVVTAAALGVAAVWGDRDDAPAPRAPRAPRDSAALLADLRWTRVAHDESVFGGVGDQEIHRVTAFGERLVGVGRDGAGRDLDAAVWSAAGPHEWERVAHDERLFGGDAEQLMWGVATDGDVLVAVGRDDARGDKDAAVWTSRDGFEWTRVRDARGALGGPGDQVMNRVAAWSGGFVAVGFESRGRNRDGAAWVSRTGARWTRVAGERVLGGPGDQVLRSVAAAPDGVVAVGSEARGEVRGDDDAAVWTSRDGARWERVEDPTGGLTFGGPEDQVAATVTAGGPGWVAAGFDTSAGSYDVAVWTSADGASWERVPRNDLVFGGPSHQFIWGISSSSPTGWLVAVGRDDVGGGPDAAVWTSIDGLTWRRMLPDEGMLGGDLAQTMKWVTVTPDHLVAAGSDRSQGDADAAVWVAPLSAP